MLKRIGLVAVLVGVALVGCGKKEVVGGEDLTAAGVVAGASGVVGEAVKVGTKVEAKYDPNLKVENVVWDSPEKKAMFEKMMAAKGGASAVPDAASAVGKASSR